MNAAHETWRTRTSHETTKARNQRRSSSCFRVFVAGCFFGVAAFAAQPPQTPLPKGQMPDLGRPTKSEDTLPDFNFDEYFPGKWTFEWDVPEGPLGPSGRITGTTIYKPVDGRFYEASTEATGPGGAFKFRELIAYHKENKALSRYVTDSRGFSFLQIGTIGGDLGGYYNIYFESSPFTHGGKTLRIRHAMRLLSPLNYKVATTLSVDGGPFRNYGNPWWRKDAAAASK
jgi:hypothetical protein